MNNNPIGIFDSGSGGITVLDSCRKLMPHESFVYVSDSRAGGWGSLSEKEILSRISVCVNKLTEQKCKAIVAACNTATEVGIEVLRHTYETPFIGVEPAIKPAVAACLGEKILVLCTPATARQTKFKQLLSACGGNVRVRPQPGLAQKIETHLDNLDVLKGEVHSIIADEKPAAVVLGCTHYVFVRYLFEKELSPETVFDGNAGTAKQLMSVLNKNGLQCSNKNGGGVDFITV